MKSLYLYELVIKNGDVSGGHCYMNDHTISEAKNQKSIDSLKFMKILTKYL